MKRSFFVCFLAISIFCSKTNAQCASPANIYTFTFGGHTYKVVKEKKGWSDAASCAVTMGGKLVEISTKAENDTVLAAIKSAGVTLNYATVSDGGGATYVWIGATDKLNEGVWLWDGDNNGQGDNFWNGEGASGDGNGEVVPGFYHNWGGASQTTTPNEPDDFLDAQDCGAIALDFWPKGSQPPYLGITGEWNDLILSNALYYVVEKNCLDKLISRDTAICKGEKVFLGGEFRTTGGVYVDSFRTALGCDSLISTTLTILGVDVTQASATICQGDTLVIGGVPRTQSGKYSAKYESYLGCDSLVEVTLTVIPNVARSRTVTICKGDSVLVGGNYQTTAGTYQDIYPSAAGCDSIVTTALVVNAADTSVSINGATLTSNAIGATYQWIDCDNGNTPISGATNQSFTATVSGHYSVMVTQNGCVGTSSCYAASPSSVLENNFPTTVSVYPNPARDLLTINLGKPYEHVELRLQAVNGVNVAKMNYRASDGIFTMDISDLASGTYFLRITSDGRSALVKLIKE